MEFYLCPDGQSVDLNGSDELEALFDSEFFDITSEGIIYKNNLEYWRTFTPTLRSNTTNVTLGTGGTVEGEYARFRVQQVLPANGTADSLDIYITKFRILVTLGTSPTVPAGTLNFTDGGVILDTTVFRDSGVDYLPGLFGNARLFDASASAVRYYNFYASPDTGYFMMSTDAGTVATNSAPWTWAVGDKIAVTGTCFNSVLCSTALT